MINLDSDKKNMLLLTLVGALFFIPFLGSTHLFDWDEINFAECAREMILTGDFFRPQIDFEPFWEKPPLFIWMQVLSMKLFGINEFSARFPNAICGISTLLFVYWAGRRYRNARFGIFWALAWLGSILPHFYFRSGIIDPWFNLLIYIGLWLFYEKINQKKNLENKETDKRRITYRFVLAGLFCGLAILTKGPVAFLLTGLTVFLYFVFGGLKNWNLIRRFLGFSLAAAFVPLMWFGADIAINGTWFVREFLTYTVRLASTEDSGHGGFLGYHFVVLFLGCFPASIFALKTLVPRMFHFGFWKNRQLSEKQNLTDEVDKTIYWNQILFWAVLIVFSIVQTKIVHYSSLCYFPLTFLATVAADNFLNNRKVPKWVINIALIPLFLFAGIVILLPYFGRNIDLIKPLFLQDAFAMANLDASVPWSYLDGLSGILLVGIGIYAWFLMRKGSIEKGIQYTYLTGLLFTAFTVVLIVPKIELYSQAAAIRFYESKVQEDCYIVPIGFKSFAHLFYSKKRPVLGDKSVDDRDVLVHEKLGSKPVYFVTKIVRAHEFSSREDIKELYRENGFVFFKKLKVVDLSN